MGQTAIVTGGTGGLGAAVVARLISGGWRVVVPWVAENELERVERVPELELVRADLFDPEAVAGVVATAAETRAPHCTGSSTWWAASRPAAGARDADRRVRGQFRVNLRPTYLVTQAALPHMLAAGGGSIVCVGTRAAVRPFSGAAGYISSKAAVIAFAQALAVEYRDNGVRCQRDPASVIDTPGNRASMPNADFDVGSSRRRSRE